MAHRIIQRYRPAWRALVAGLEATMVALSFACSGGGSGGTAPDLPGDPLPAPEQPGAGPGPTQPGPTPAPGPEQPAGIQGTYLLTQINNSKPGQLVTVANPDGAVIGLYRNSMRRRRSRSTRCRRSRWRCATATTRATTDTTTTASSSRLARWKARW